MKKYFNYDNLKTAFIIILLSNCLLTILGLIILSILEDDLHPNAFYNSDLIKQYIYIFEYIFEGFFPVFQFTLPYTLIIIGLFSTVKILITKLSKYKNRDK